jgi:hypothetical protein
MNDYLALLTLIGILAGIGWISRRRIWHTCRCGIQTCIQCGSRRQK